VPKSVSMFIMSDYVFIIWSDYDFNDVCVEREDETIYND
jgi:hypothetical protein